MSLPKFVLASASPRRKQLLEDAGFTVEIISPGEVEESAREKAPEALAVEKSRLKARAVAALLDEEIAQGKRANGAWWVIGADTLCALGDQILEKPLDRADAERILLTLSGTRHRVITGLVLWPAGLAWPDAKKPGAIEVFDTTWVRMKNMSLPEIRAYVDSGEADGKAGAYAIQEKGDRFVDALEGSFANVVGFPIELFQRLCREQLKA